MRALFLESIHEEAALTFSRAGYEVKTLTGSPEEAALTAEIRDVAVPKKLNSRIGQFASAKMCRYLEAGDTMLSVNFPERQLESARHSQSIPRVPRLNHYTSCPLTMSLPLQ